MEPRHHAKVRSAACGIAARRQYGYIAGGYNGHVTSAGPIGKNIAVLGCYTIYRIQPFNLVIPAISIIYCIYTSRSYIGRQANPTFYRT
jgi:hypothetical protein